MADIDFDSRLTMLIETCKGDVQRAEARVEAAHEALESLSETLENLLATRAYYIKTYGLEPDKPVVDEKLRALLTGLTVKQMMVTIAEMSDSRRFKVSEMITKLISAGMYPDHKTARDTVYSILGRNRKTFLRAAPGEYLLNPTTVNPKQGHLEAVADGGSPSTSGRRRKGTGFTARVAAIHSQHPDWSRNKIVAELNRQGWDFGTKNAPNSVGAVLNNLDGKGRSKNRPPTGGSSGMTGRKYGGGKPEPDEGTTLTAAHSRVQATPAPGGNDIATGW